MAPAIIAGIVIQFALMRMTASQVEAVQPASLAHLLVGIVVVVLYTSGAAGTALMRALRNDERALLLSSR